MLQKSILNFCPKIKNFFLILIAFVFPISLAATNILLILALICFVIEGNFREKLNVLKNNIFVKFFLGMVGVLFISTLFSHSIKNGFLISSGYKNEYQFILKHFIWLFSFFVLLVTSKIDRQKLISAFLLGMFFSEIVSYSIFFHLIDVNYFKSLGLINRETSYLNPTPFMHHTFYSIFLVVSIFLIFDNLKNFRGFFKIISIFFLISATINLFINGGRTGQLGFFLAFVVYFIFKTKSFKTSLAVFVLTSIIGLIAYNFSPVFNNRVNLAINDLKMVKKGNFDTSWGKRVAVDIVGFEILKNPEVFLFGLGAGDAKKEFYRFAKEYNKKMYNQFKGLVHLHNQFLQFWMDGGVLLVLIYVLWFYFWFKLSPTPLTAAIITIFIIASFADVIIYRPKTFILFLFLTFLSTYYETNNTAKENV
ncbi:O-antigen ligase family protein [Caminibacter sp.]